MYPARLGLQGHPTGFFSLRPVVCLFLILLLDLKGISKYSAFKREFASGRSEK